MNKKTKAEKVILILKDIYGEPVPTLNYENEFELLIAVILSAQCTDKRVDIVTAELFKKYKTPKEFMEMDIKELEKIIHSTGFYKNKSKNIKKCAKMLVEKYDGIVPNNMDDLIKLPGVGRKTANVMLGHIFNIPGVVVDTHVKRLSNRIGLTKQQDPVKIEFELMKIIQKKDWFLYSNLLIYHGRAICTARNPKCDNCKIRVYCEYGRGIK
ncbi:endonuclease III [Haliovirga abyssi]|uniref:Endonuclease III n=1 Tax=Haliovirga abyssi TaxID=2996794 RepID=A0AAU9DN86_9FUSO|nr:endonuclease III [Haliovirga abyssi]BDU49798.1 endonuclease III [Haliovirga abyssi]